MTSPSCDLSVLMSVAHRAATREGLNPSDAEDVASIALLHYLKAASKIEHPTAWIFLVARRKAWGLRRQRERMRFMENTRTSLVDSTSNIFDSVETQLDLKAALAALAPVERCAVFSRYVEGIPVEAIAETLGLSETTVKRRLRSARESLRRALSGRSMRRYLHCANLGTTGIV